MLPVSIVILLTARLTAASPIAKECFTQTGPYVMGDAKIELVFSGRVVDYSVTADDAYRATFDVDRVWKGTVSKRIDIYVWTLESAEMPRYDKGREYVVLAKRLTDPRLRKAVGLGDSDATAFGAANCADALSPRIREELGPGSPPRQPD